MSIKKERGLSDAVRRLRGAINEVTSEIRKTRDEIGGFVGAILSRRVVPRAFVRKVIAKRLFGGK